MLSHLSLLNLITNKNMLMYYNLCWAIFERTTGAENGNKKRVKLFNCSKRSRKYLKICVDYDFD